MDIKRIVLAVVAGSALISLSGMPPAGAGQAPPIFPHRHFLETPDGTWRPVGPQVCEDPDLQNAFNEFHRHVHVGPANTAFDHEHNRVDIKATFPC